MNKNLRARIGELIGIFATTEIVSALLVLEITAFVVMFAGVLAATVLPLAYESRSVERALPEGTQVITLTGLADTGTWTDLDVTAANYWGSFPAAMPVLEVGRPVLLRLQSADVIHTFYSPALGIGPIEVYPGHVEEVLVTPDQEGVFEYYCTTICGRPHFNMRGVILVGKEGSLPPVPAHSDPDPYWLAPPPREDAPLVERGAWLFRQKGCVTCHGPEGRGGVPNWNYINDTVPALNTLAEKMFLFFPEDIDAIVTAIEQGVPLESLSDDPPVRRFAAMLAQYESTRDVMRKGNPPGKKDPEGPAPPLEMLSWEHQVTERDIDALMVFLLTRNPSDAAP